MVSQPNSSQIELFKSSGENSSIFNIAMYIAIYRKPPKNRNVSFFQYRAALSGSVSWGGEEFTGVSQQRCLGLHDIGKN